MVPLDTRGEAEEKAREIPIAKQAQGFSEALDSSSGPLAWSHSLRTPGICTGRCEWLPSPDRRLSGQCGARHRLLVGGGDGGGARVGGGSAALLGQKGPSWDPPQARPWGDRGQGDKHTRHHHTTSPEKQEDNINPSRRYVLCRWDPSSRETKWRPDSSGREVGDRETQERKEKQNREHQYPRCIQLCSVYHRGAA